MATIAERLEFLKKLNDKELSIMAAKANDYSGNTDCNRNILACERLGLCSADTALLVRILDKLSRLGTLLSGVSQKVSDESIDDTISDARNYLGILAHIRSERSNNG